MVTALLAVGMGAAALGVGLLLGARRQRSAQGRAGGTADQMLREARAEAQRLLDRSDGEARALAETYREREEDTLQHRKVELGATTERLDQREDTLEQRAANLAQREAHLIERERDVTEVRRQADEFREQAREELAALAGVDARAAKEELMQRVEDEARRDAMVLMRDMELKAREEAERRARRVLTSTVQRLASNVVAETTVSVVELPSDEMKGRIIGRDGRNIRAFEATTGVNIIVDDTPEAVALSTFDPVRR
jgi:ribonucrease Y